jgi:hypothetical protein
MAQVLNEIFQLTEIKRPTFDFNDFRFWLAPFGASLSVELEALRKSCCCCGNFQSFPLNPVGIVFTTSRAKLITIYLFCSGLRSAPRCDTFD